METRQLKIKKIRGSGLVDFGKEAFARLCLSLKGKPGTTVKVSIGEKLTDDGHLDSAPGGALYYHQEEIVLKKNEEWYEFPIPEHKTQFDKAAVYFCRPPAETDGEVAPFRYVFIEGYTGEVALMRLAFTYQFDDVASHFHCSNKNLNKIWDFCKYSIKATSTFGLFVDGDRERFPYEADTFINQLGWFCNSTNFGIARDTIERFLFFYPTWLTEYNLLIPTLVNDYILYSGDTECLNRWYDALKRTLHPEMEGTDGLLHARNGIQDIVDWPICERDGYEMGEVNFVPNAFYYGALNRMFFLGSDKAYLRKAEVVRAALRRTMMKHGTFVDNPESNHTSLHTAMYAVYFNIAETSEIPALMKFIRSRGMACSVYGAYYLLASSFINGYASYGLELMTSHDLRSWNNMLDKGATITMEAWDGSFKPNQDWNHAWGAAPASIIPRFLCGIRPMEPGFRDFLFLPKFAGLKEVYFCQPTVRGPIIVEAKGKKVRLTVPDDTRCFAGDGFLSPGIHDLKIK